LSEVRFGPYRILEILGAGAVSTIYKAVQEPLGRVVAVKTLKTEIAPGSSFSEQLDREAKVLADLVHPNVVMLLDVGRSPAGRPYLALEHVDGPSLQKLLAKKKRLPVDAALAIALALAAALEHVHERGVVHRDVKPGNVLLSKQGAVKLVDFGIAQRARTPSVSDALGGEGITLSGRITTPVAVKDAFGTPAYMSPEQILGDFVDGRSDLFSLGVVLYQMLSGSRPFEQPGDRTLGGAGASAGGDDGRPSRPPSDRASAQRIRRDHAQPLRERVPHVPRTVERVVMRMLEKAPQDRYATASAVRERLEAALRAITRDDPAAVVRAALASAGFAEKTRRGPGAPGAAGGHPGHGAAGPRSAASSLAAALGGHAVVLALFIGGAVFVEGASCASRDAARASGERLELAPESAGGLRVVATPWALVKIDGQDVETTPFARAIPLSAGSHYVTLVHPDAPPVERRITVAPGEIVTLDVTLPVDDLDAGKDGSP
jgi:serine/threonine-protein kinase